MLGDSIPVTAGIGLGARMQGRQVVAMAWIGDGGTSTGAFHEGLNFAAVQKLPLVRRRRRQQVRLLDADLRSRWRSRGSTSARRRTGFRTRWSTATTCSPCTTSAKRVVDRARAGEGASLIGVDTMRMQGHAQHDDARYVPKALLDEWRERDPLARYRGWLLTEGRRQRQPSSTRSTG